MAYAAAIVGSVPRQAKLANLLPADRRASHGRLRLVIPAVLGALLVLLAIAVFLIYPAMDQKRYARELEAEARKLEPSVKRVQRLDAQADRESRAHRGSG